MSSGDTASVQNDRDLISLFHIRSAGHDLYRLCPYIDLADDQLICIRMTLNLLDLTDHNVFQVPVSRRISLYFRS